MVSNGYAFIVEMLYEASRRGCRIGEVPIIFVERRLGQSKVSGRVLAESLIVPWRLVLGKRKPGGSPPDRRLSRASGRWSGVVTCLQVQQLLRFTAS